jgi:hypothetical protein
MPNLENHSDNLNQLLNKIDQAAGNGCLNYPVSIEVIDCLKQLVEMDSAEAAKQLVDRWVAWIAQDSLQPLVNNTAEHLRTNKHALPVLVFKLPVRQDPETCWHMAIMMKKEINMSTHRVLPIPMIERLIVALILLTVGGAILITVVWPLIHVSSDQAPGQVDPWEVVNDFHASINSNDVDDMLALFADSASVTENKSQINGKYQIQNWVMYSKRMAGLHLRMFHSDIDGEKLIWLDKAQNGSEGLNRYYILRWEALIVAGKIQSLVVTPKYIPDLK